MARSLRLWWRWVRWPVLAALVVGLSLSASMRSYVTSQKMKEPVVAELEAEKGGRNPTTVGPFKKSGKVRVYYYKLDVNPRKIKVAKGSEEFSYTLDASKKFVDTHMRIKKDDKVKLTVWDDSNKKLSLSYGWERPVDKICGSGGEAVDVTEEIKHAKQANEPLVSIQCWNDWEPEENPNLDFNDFLLIFSYQPQASPSASPTPSPSVSPSPSPSPDSQQAMFVIHKFLDANKNGIRETGEGSTNRAWEFEYQINDGDKRSYTIEPGTEEGEKILVNKGDKVKVQELGQEGWLNTTGASLEKTIYENKTYYFYFGNYSVLAPSFPPKQPDTGAATWLTAGAGALVVGFLVIKLLMGI